MTAPRIPPSLSMVVRCSAPDYLAVPPNRLSTYGLFEGDGASQQPEDGVVPYAINSQLFSDYAMKRRFIKLPGGQPAAYDPTQTFELPVRTIIATAFCQGLRTLRPPPGWRATMILQPARWMSVPVPGSRSTARIAIHRERLPGARDST